MAWALTVARPNSQTPTGLSGAVNLVGSYHAFKTVRSVEHNA